MNFRIPAGKHRARPLRFGFWWQRNSFAWTVKFTESCRYDLQNADQGDTNKLIGVGYARGWFRPANTTWWKLWKYHHKDSARFGWRYWTERKEIELSAYCYVNGRREIQHICFCEIGKEYHIMLNATQVCYHLHAYERYSTTCLGMATIQHTHNKHFKYRLGVFFGGNKVAPHKMKIEIKKA